MALVFFGGVYSGLATPPVPSPAVVVFWVVASGWSWLGLAGTHVSGQWAVRLLAVHPVLFDMCRFVMVSVF